VFNNTNNNSIFIENSDNRIYFNNNNSNNIVGLFISTTTATSISRYLPFKAHDSGTKVWDHDSHVWKWNEVGDDSEIKADL
jgi:hypothetical protein